GQNNVFYMLGPTTAFPSQTPNNPAPKATLQVNTHNFTDSYSGLAYRSGMSYTSPVASTNLATPPAHCVLLRRLACPYLPPQPDSTPATIVAKGYYNPYI